MLWFMVGTAHFYTGETFGFDLGAGKVVGFLIIALVIWAVLEANALGFIGGHRGQARRKQIYETVRNAIISGFVLWAIFWLLSELFLKACLVAVVADASPLLSIA